MFPNVRQNLANNINLTKQKYDWIYLNFMSIKVLLLGRALRKNEIALHLLTQPPPMRMTSLVWSGNLYLLCPLWVSQRTWGCRLCSCRGGRTPSCTSCEGRSDTPAWVRTREGSSGSAHHENFPLHFEIVGKLKMRIKRTLSLHFFRGTSLQDFLGTLKH